MMAKNNIFDRNNPPKVVSFSDHARYNKDSKKNNSNDDSGGGGGMDIDNRLGKVEIRLDNVETRLDRIDSKLDRFESRFDNIENILSRNTAFLETNLEWLKESNKDVKAMLSKADAELANSKRHTQIMVYTSYALVLASAIGIAGIWFTTWSTNNQILSTLTQLVQTLSKQ